MKINKEETISKGDAVRSIHNNFVYIVDRIDLIDVTGENGGEVVLKILHPLYWIDEPLEDQNPRIGRYEYKAADVRPASEKAKKKILEEIELVKEHGAEIEDI